MKILVDLLSTDYGLMSFIVIIAMLLAMGSAAVYVIVKAKKK
jgi:hypothetical protein